MHDGRPGEVCIGGFGLGLVCVDDKNTCFGRSTHELDGLAVVLERDRPFLFFQCNRASCSSNVTACMPIAVLLAYSLPPEKSVILDFSDGIVVRETTPKFLFVVRMQLIRLLK